MSSTVRIERARNSLRKLGPGILFGTVAGAVCFVIVRLVPGAPVLLAAILVGMAAGNIRAVPAWARPGIGWSAKKFLRAGVVLLGLQLSIFALASLGVAGIAVILVTTVATFFGTLAAGRLLRVSRVTRYLIATGFAICGASAVAAMSSVVDREQKADEEVVRAIALVTLYGTVTLLALPLLWQLAGLDETEAGLWIGASVHEVGQVVAAGGAVSAVALAIATVAKLARVVLLAPLVAAVGIVESRRAETIARGPRPPVVPLFVAGFLVMVVVRTFVPLPAAFLDVTSAGTTLLLAIAMFGLGTQVDLRSLIRTSPRSLALGAISTVIAAGVSLGSILFTR